MEMHWKLFYYRNSLKIVLLLKCIENYHGEDLLNKFIETFIHSKDNTKRDITNTKNIYRKLLENILL